MPKVFLDTNILFSAILLPNSIPDLALQKALSSPFTAMTADYCLEELKNKFAKKFPYKIEALNRFIQEIILVIEVVEISTTERQEEQLIRDVKDRPILRAAIEQNADILITGDKDFLESSITKPKIIKASDFYFSY